MNLVKTTARDILKEAHLHLYHRNRNNILEYKIIRVNPRYFGAYKNDIFNECNLDLLKQTIKNLP